MESVLQNKLDCEQLYVSSAVLLNVDYLKKSFSDSNCEMESFNMYSHPQSEIKLLCERFPRIIERKTYKNILAFNRFSLVTKNLK